MNKFTAYILYPAFGFLIIAAPAIFHTLFQFKWDSSIVLFELLLIRGIFVVISSLFSNYILALGKSKLLVEMELLRDGVALIALIVTMPIIGMSTVSNPVLGIEYLLYGQIFASGLTCIVTVFAVSKITERNLFSHIYDNLPYITISFVSLVIPYCIQFAVENPISLLLCQFVATALIYVGINWLLKSKIQKEVLTFLFLKFRRDRKIGKNG